MKDRNAHSLIEMLVVLIIVAVLIAIVVPAVQRARESSRMAQCIHNQGQLAKAVHLHVADEPYGRFPGYRAFAADGATVIGWAPQVFEHLGRKDLPEDPTQATYIEVLVCPSNQGPKDSPRLNYVVNGGRSGIDSPADGIFFDHAKGERVYITKDDFGDGLTNTILLAENLDATQWNETDEASQCILWPLVEGSEINRGEGARPSSHHPGGFVAAFADGSVKFMNEVDLNEDESIYSAGSMYSALLTPGGDDAPATEIVGVDPCDPLDQPQVTASLEWIVRHQFDNGGWSFAHSTHSDCNGSCSMNGSAVDAPISATALALLPLLGGGSSPVSGPYRDQVCMGIEYLMASQDPGTGGIHDPAANAHAHMYSHLLANIALAEAFLLANEANQGRCTSSSGASEPCNIDMNELRSALVLATQHTIDAQVEYVDDGNLYESKGGWTYAPNAHPNGKKRADLSHTTWALMALKTAEVSGISVPQETYERVKLFLESVTWQSVEDQGISIGTSFSYDRASGDPTWGQPSVRMTVLGQLCHVLLGAPTDHAAIQQFTTTLVPDSGGTHYGEVYYNMHTTHLMYLVGGSQWDAWNTAIRDLLLPAQLTSSAGHAEGSWDHSNPPVFGNSQVGMGGRLYMTSLYSLCLETYFAGLKFRKH